MHSSAPHLIFWTPSGENIPAGSQSLMERYLGDLAADSGRATNVFGVARQYTDSTGFADYRQTFKSAGQVLVDSQPYPSQDMTNCPDVAATYPKCITDAQLQTELSRLIAAQSLPTGIGPDAPIYLFVTPADVNVCMNASTCADNFFCAYHSSLVEGGTTTLYAAIPLFINGASPAQDPKSCQVDGNSAVQEPNRDLADVAISYLSHEVNETLTDPLGDGWWDPMSGNEEADNCASTGAVDPGGGTNPDAFLPTITGDATAGTLFDQVIDGNPYYTQSVWSNGDQTCEMQPTGGALNAAFAATTGTAGTPVSVDPSTSSSAGGYTSTSWNFGDGTTSFSRAAPSTVSHTYSTPGAYPVSLTLVDNDGNLSTISHTVTVRSPPSAAFTVKTGRPKARSPVSFDASGSNEAGGSISSYGWSFGDGSTGSGVAPTHSFPHAGTYTVTLLVADGFGHTAATSRTVAVAGLPSAKIVVGSAPVAGVPVSLRGGRSTDVGSKISSYRWRFGDGSTGSGASVSHRYRRPGRYTASLSVTDRSGAVSTTTRVLTVKSASITSLTLKRGGKFELLRLRIDGPGALKIGSKKLKIRKAQVFVFRLELSSAQMVRIRSHHSVTIKLQLKFVPTAGKASRKTITIKVKG